MRELGRVTAVLEIRRWVWEGREGQKGDLSGRGTARAEDAQGTPTQSHISPSILVYEEEGCSRDGRDDDVDLVVAPILLVLPV